MAPRTTSGSSPGAADGGYALAALLVGLAVMGILTSAALPVWSQAARREREAELVFRGEQYARAVALYQRVYAGAYPPDVDTLIEQRFLRRRYRDPMVADGRFRVVYESDAADFPAEPGAALERSGASARDGGTSAFGAARPASGARDRALAEGLRGGVIGVASRSEEESLRVYHGATKYSEWVFVYAPAGAAGGGAAGGALEVAPRPGQVGSSRPSAPRPFGSTPSAPRPPR